MPKANGFELNTQKKHTANNKRHLEKYFKFSTGVAQLKNPNKFNFKKIYQKFSFLIAGLCRRLTNLRHNFANGGFSSNF